MWQEVARDFKRSIVGNGKLYYLHGELLSRWPELTVVSSTSFEKLHQAGQVEEAKADHEHEAGELE